MELLPSSLRVRVGVAVVVLALVGASLSFGLPAYRAHAERQADRRIDRMLERENAAFLQGVSKVEGAFIPFAAQPRRLQVLGDHLVVAASGDTPGSPASVLEFAPPLSATSQAFPVALPAPHSAVSVADVGEGGAPALITSGPGQAWLRREGASWIPFEAPAGSATPVDVDGDGRTELVSGFAQPDAAGVRQVQIWSGSTPSPGWSGRVDPLYMDTRVGDVLGDAGQEIVFVHRNGGRHLVASPADTSGALRSIDPCPGRFAPVQGTHGQFSHGSLLAVADVTGDGRPERLCAGASFAFFDDSGGRIGGLMAIMKGTLVDPVLDADDVALFDVDTDGDKDLAVITSSHRGVRILHNDGRGNFS